MKKGKSCKDRLQQIRKDLGISKKDYKRAAKEEEARLKGELPSRDKMKTFVMAQTEEQAERLIQERGLTNTEVIIKPKEALNKKGRKMLKMEKKEKKKSKRAWYTNDAWIDADGVYHNVQDGDIVLLKDEMNQLSKKKKFKIAKFWLFDYLKPEHAQPIWESYGDDDIMELVHYCVLEYYRWREYYLIPAQRQQENRKTLSEWIEESADELFAEEIHERDWPVEADDNCPGYPIVYIEDDNIPYFYEKQYKKYCKKHPLVNGLTAKARKKRFIDKMNREYDKHYGVDKFDIQNPNMTNYDMLNFLFRTKDKQKVMNAIAVVTAQNLKRARELERDMKKYFGSSYRSPIRDMELEDVGYALKEFADKVRESRDRAMKNQRKRFKKWLDSVGVDPGILKDIERRVKNGTYESGSDDDGPDLDELNKKLAEAGNGKIYIPKAGKGVTIYNG